MSDGEISNPSDQDARPIQPRGEKRWPVLGMLAVASVLPLFLPERLTLGPKWLLPVIEGVLLIAVAVTDPGRIDQRSRQVRALRLTLICVLAAGTAFATGHLLDELIRGGGITGSADLLLRAGGVVWIELVIVFAFLYWELDAAGPASAPMSRSDIPISHFPSTSVPTSLDPGGALSSTTTSTSATRTRPHSARQT